MVQHTDKKIDINMHKLSFRSLTGCLRGIEENWTYLSWEIIPGRTLDVENTVQCAYCLLHGYTTLHTGVIHGSMNVGPGGDN